MSSIGLPTPLSPAPLSETEKALSSAILGNPEEYPDGYKSWLEQFILLRVPTQASLEAMVARIAHPVGFFLIVPDDLTANTGEYVYTHPLTGLKYLYCNGAAVSQTTYADLYAFWGASKYAADSGGNFTLLDSRARALILAGTHADVDVGDTFGPATESSRRGQTHGHAVTALSVTGAPSAGTLAVASHTHPAASDSFLLTSGLTFTPTGSGTAQPTGSAAATGATAPAITGAPGVGTLDVGGTIGSDTNEGGSAIVIGSLVVRF